MNAPTKPAGLDDYRDGYNSRQHNGDAFASESFVDDADGSTNREPTLDANGRPVFRYAVSRMLGDVVERPVEWTVYKRIVRGANTVIAGPGGVGKSTLMTDLIGRFTNSGVMPDGTKCPVGQVIIATGEESYEFTVKARCRVAGADMSMVHTLEGLKAVDENGSATEIAFDLTHVHALEEMLDYYKNVVAVFIDPLGSFIGGGTDSNTDNKVRAVLQPVGRLMEKHNCAGIFLAHHRKMAGGSADDLVLGSRAITASCRGVFHVFDDNGVKLLLPGKGNLSPLRTGLAYTIEPIPGEDVGRVVWRPGTVDMDANAYLAELSKPGPSPDSQNDAAEWLRDALLGGPKTKAELQKRMKADACPFSWTTADRAMKAAKVKCERDASKKWVYRLLKDGSNQPQEMDGGE